MIPIYSFPTFPVKQQLFYVPGAVLDNGVTSGGARITMTEPGGFSVLEIQPAMLLTEWDYPLASWLMSKTNGDVFKVRLAPTPQVSVSRLLRGLNGVPWDNNGPWDNGQLWTGEISAVYATEALRGTSTLKIDMSIYGQILQQGHVIGHSSHCYLIDDIVYDPDTTVATITVKPALRRTVVAGDPVFFRPWFTGQISNGADFRNSYDAENVGLIELNKIIFNEVIITDE